VEGKEEFLDWTVSFDGVSALLSLGCSEGSTSTPESALVWSMGPRCGDWTGPAAMMGASGVFKKPSDIFGTGGTSVVGAIGKTCGLCETTCAAFCFFLNSMAFINRFFSGVILFDLANEVGSERTLPACPLDPGRGP